MTPEERAADRFPAYNYRDGGNESRAAQYAYASCIREEVEPLEAEVAKLRELVQVLVDALEGACYYARTYEDCPYLDGDKALATAKEAGFTPTNTEDNG